MNEEDYSHHFCKGIEAWKPICFECKYPIEKRERILMKELNESRKDSSHNRKLAKDSTIITKKKSKELEFYKDALKKAIEDIKWSKKNTISKKDVSVLLSEGGKK